MPDSQSGYFGQIGGMAWRGDPRERGFRGPVPLNALPGRVTLPVVLPRPPVGAGVALGAVDPEALLQGVGAMRADSILYPPRGSEVREQGDYGNDVFQGYESRVGGLAQRQVGERVRQRRQGELRGFPRAAVEDAADALLGPDYATPADLRRLDSTYEAPYEGDPAQQDSSGGRGRPEGEFAIVETPINDRLGNWRGPDGKALAMRRDPTAGVLVETVNPEAYYASDREREVNEGQLIEQLWNEYKTPVVDDARLFELERQGAFVPNPNAGKRDPIGFLTRTRYQSGAGAAPLPRREVAVQPAITGLNEIGLPSGGFMTGMQRALSEVLESRLPRNPAQSPVVSAPIEERIPVYGPVETRGSDGVKTLYRLGNPLNRDYEAVNRGFLAQVPVGGQVDIVNRGGAKVISPRRLDEAIAQGFQVEAPDPETGARVFARPDGTSGVLIPEVVLRKGNVRTDQPTGQYIVADSLDQVYGTREYGRGFLSEDAGVRRWLENPKQADINPDGMTTYQFQKEMIDAGRSGGPQELTDTRRVVVQLANQIAADQGLPLDTVLRQMAGGSETQAQALYEAATSLYNDSRDTQLTLREPYAGGTKPVGTTVRPYVKRRNPDGTPAEFGYDIVTSGRASRTPAQRRLDALYASPASPLPAPVTPVDQLELPLPLAAAVQPSPGELPTAEMDEALIGRAAGWSDLEVGDIESASYGSGYRVATDLAAPQSNRLQPFAELAQQYVGDPAQASLIADVAMRTASPGPDGTVSADAVIERVQQIAGAPVRSYRDPGLDPLALGNTAAVRGAYRPMAAQLPPLAQVVPDQGAREQLLAEGIGAALAREPGDPVQQAAMDLMARRVAARQAGGTTPPELLTRYTGQGPVASGPDRVVALTPPAEAVAAARAGYQQALSSGLGPRQTWIPGVPSSPAELAVSVPADQQRVLDYWARAGQRDRTAAALEQAAAGGYYQEPGPRVRQLRLFGR
jgi:hypothetical protein